MIKAVIFDLDGTLLDTSEFILQAFEHTIKTHNLSSWNRPQLMKRIGYTLPDTYKEISDKMEAKVFVDTHQNFQATNFHLIKSYPNVKETLEALKEKGIRMVVVTNRSSKNSVLTLEQNKIDKYFELVLSREDVEPYAKPHPYPFKKAMEFLKAKSEETVAVGDSIVDVLTAKAAGVKVILVSYGFGYEDGLREKPDYTVNDFSEIVGIIKS